MAKDYSHWLRIPKRACFDCRKCFKDRTTSHIFEPTKTCPHCGGELHNMGTHFKAPKRSDDKAWKAIKLLYAAGVRYDVFDWHNHWWTEKYKKGGENCDAYALKQLLAEIGLKLPHVEDETDKAKPSAVPQPRFHSHEIQWKGPRPTHPREVPPFLEWWQEQNLDRIAMAVEACEKLGYEPPEGLRGELLLKELESRFRAELAFK